MFHSIFLVYLNYLPVLKELVLYTQGLIRYFIYKYIIPCPGCDVPLLQTKCVQTKCSKTGHRGPIGYNPRFETAPSVKISLSLRMLLTRSLYTSIPLFADQPFLSDVNTSAEKANERTLSFSVRKTEKPFLRNFLPSSFCW